MRTLTLLLAGLIFVASNAHGAVIRYTLEQGVDGGFGYSSVHDADDSTPMSGPIVGTLSGTMDFDYNAGTDLYTLVASDVIIDPASGYGFSFLGGSIQGNGIGSLDFELTGAGPFAQTSTILFAGPAPVCCGAGGPNFMTNGTMRLWGASTVPQGQGRIGVDLGGSGAPVPEPSAALVFGLGLLLASRRIRRRA